MTRGKARSGKVAKKRTAARTRTAQFDFDAFVRDAREELQKKLDRGKSEFGIGSYERFDVDQTRAVIEFFSTGGVVRLAARARIVGSISNESKTWLWSWANASILPGARQGLDEVRAFGKSRRLRPLFDEKCPATVDDGWSMTSVAAKILGSACAYRTPTRTGFAFVLLDDLRRPSRADGA